MPIANLAAVPIIPSPGALRVQTETQPLASIAYGYDALGRLASRTVSGSGPETFGYDALGRLSAHASDLGAFTLGYNGESGQIASRVSANLSTQWTYQPNAMDRRLAGVATTWLPSGQFTGFAYTSNAENQITNTTQTSEAAIGLPGASISQTASYAGNPLNELTQLNGGRAWIWDADGEPVLDASRRYTWDGENRLLSAVQGVAASTAIAYDGLGRRTQITTTTAGVATTTTQYVWCGAQLCQARNAAGALIRAYYAEGEYLPGSARALFYAPDNLGSVRRVFGRGTGPEQARP